MVNTSLAYVQKNNAEERKRGGLLNSKLRVAGKTEASFLPENVNFGKGCMSVNWLSYLLS